MKVKYDDKQIHLTKAFVESVRNMLTEHILMMRVRNQENRECWVVGACTIEDMALANGMSFSFGSLNDASWLIKDAHIFVEVPL
jgi:hypothetical protein